MTGAAEMGRPLTPWQRLVARFLPWYDADAQEARSQRTDEVVKAAESMISGVRIGYTQAGNRIERRRVPR